MKSFIKYLSFALVCLLIFGIVACSMDDTLEESDTETESVQDTAEDERDTETERVEDESESDNEDDGDSGEADENKETFIMLNSEATFLKLLDGRQEFTANGITCDFSCAGIEFEAQCEGDITVGVAVSSSTGCYFRAYVDGVEWKNGDSPYYECLTGAKQIILKDIPAGKHTIRIVKATGYTLARTTLTSIRLESGAPIAAAPADNDLYIEYIGDSIFCGWGVVKTAWGAYNGTYQSQDGTLAIPYLVSGELDADYSVVAVSGQGVVYGKPNIENAYKYASYDRDCTVEYGFERKADVVVVNVGTNDYSHRDSVSAEQFSEAYTRMLRYVREKNGEDCIILVTYNMMNDCYGSEIVEVISSLGGAENNYYVVKSERCGAVNSSHPSAEENVKYAKVIGDTIKAIMDNSYTDTDQDTDKDTENENVEPLIELGSSMAENDIPATPWKED